ncbi:MAG: STAS domain-containing protein [Clostridia bacterium]|nr:STAS domain-containing protein [Clostridia bacterium]
MEIKYVTKNNALIAKLYGDLDEYSAEYVRMSLDKILSDMSFVGGASLILDFSHVTFMDSTGIGVLIGRYKKYEKKQVEIKISSPPAQVDRIMKMAGIYRLMPLV